MKISIDTDGYHYTEGDYFSAEALLYAPLKVLAARHLLQMQKEWTEMTSEAGVEADPLLKYADSAFPLAVVLEIDGMPMGVVRLLDDLPQYIGFDQSDKTKQEEGK